MKYREKRTILRENNVLRYFWYAILIINVLNLIGYIYITLDITSYINPLFMAYSAAAIIHPIAGLLIFLQLLIIPLQFFVLVGVLLLWKSARHLLLSLVIYSFLFGGGYFTFTAFIFDKFVSSSSDLNLLRGIINWGIWLIGIGVSVFMVVAYCKIISAINKFEVKKNSQGEILEREFDR